jgi:DNA-binding transcriptional regulator YiaG
MSLLLSKAKLPAVDMNALVLPLRELCGLTQEQFAARIGVTVVTVNRWENYRSKPMPLALRQLRAVLTEISQSAIEADRTTAQRLLAQYFCKD